MGPTISWPCLPLRDRHSTPPAATSFRLFQNRNSCLSPCLLLAILFLPDWNRIYYRPALARAELTCLKGSQVPGLSSPGHASGCDWSVTTFPEAVWEEQSKRALLLILPILCEASRNKGHLIIESLRCYL